MKPHHSIFKFYTEQVASLGFIRLKTAWWARNAGPVLQKIHIHKFTFTTSFRVHAAVHIEGFGEDVHWLNGISSHDGWYEKRLFGLRLRRYVFDFTESSASWQPCAKNLGDFRKDVLVPWFDKWADPDTLQTDLKSPLDAEQKRFLGCCPKH